MSDAERMLNLLQADMGGERPVVGLNDTVTPAAVRAFANGTGDDPARWLNAGIAPPTFLFSFVSLTDPFTQRVGEFAGNKWRAFWYRDHWLRERPLRIGEQVTVTQRTASVELVQSRSGEPRIDRTLESHFHATGELVCSYRLTIRHVPPGAVGSSSSTPGVPRVIPEDEVDEIRAAYLAERDTVESIDLATLSVGDSSPVLLKGPMTISEQVAWVMGAGAPFVMASRNAWTSFGSAAPRSLETGAPDVVEALHWDNAVARSTGMPGGYDRGPQRVSWLAHAVTSWFGARCHVAELDARILAPNFMGEVTRVSATVIERLKGGAVRVATTAEGRHGTTAKGTATVLPATTDAAERPTRGLHDG